MYTPIQSERIYERIVEQIRQNILTGELKVGEQLPSERELAEKFMVSRTAVREAIKALREIGLVEILPGRGTFITNSASRAMRHSLDFMMRMGIERSADLVEVRDIFEPEMAALAAQRATEENLQAMQAAVTTMDAALNDPDVFIEADLDFHLALAEASQNAVLPMLIDSIVEVLRGQRRSIALPGGMARGQAHHKQILDAVTRRDAEAARAAMRAHLRQIQEDTQTGSPDKV